MTLMEVLLVLVIIVLAGGIVGLNLRGPIENQRLQKSAQLVSGEWGQARVLAIRADRPFVFVHAIEGPQYLIEPWVDDAAFIQETDEIADEDAFDPYDEKNRIHGRLPDGVTFTHYTKIEDTRAGRLAPYAEVETRPLEDESADPDESSDSVNWSRPIFFYPDGTSSSAALTLTNEREWATTVRLRGLTGSVTTEPLRRQEDVEREMMEIEQ